MYELDRTPSWVRVRVTKDDLEYDSCRSSCKKIASFDELLEKEKQKNILMNLMKRYG